MSSGDATTFEIERQSAQNVSNIGGDQKIYYGDRSRAARLGKVLAALGLVLFVAGLAVLMAVGVTTANSVVDATHAGGLQTPYTQYLSSGWPAAVVLLAGGQIVNRVARIMVGR